MAKKCMIERETKRAKMVKSHAARRAKLKAVLMDREVSADERWAAQTKMNALPRNGSKSRIRNRCRLTGRSRGNFRKFGLCRNMLRHLASRGEIPGVVKASW